MAVRHVANRRWSLETARVEEEERRRIAADLHDRVSQALACPPGEREGSRPPGRASGSPP